MTKSNHIICSTNPIGKDNWTYKHFFKDEENKYLVLDDEELYTKRIIVHNNTYYHHSTCDDNYFLPLDYIEELDKMEAYDKDLHRVARKGQFGVNGTKVLPQFEVAKSHEEIINAIANIPMNYYKNGMDFGFETSYNALVRMAIDHKKKHLYIFDEYYKNKMTDDKTAEDLKEYKDKHLLIIADCAEPKTIKYYQQEGFNMKPCKKFAGSRLQNTKKVKRFKRIICSPNCKNVIRELKDLTYKVDKLGNPILDKFNIDPHTFSAIWYGLDGYEVADLKQGPKKVSNL